MKVLLFLDGLGLGGTEKAACLWAAGLNRRNHEVLVLALADGPRRQQLEKSGVMVKVAPPEAKRVAEEISAFAPQIIHAQAPGFAHIGDVLGPALALLSKKIPVVETNIFGRLENPSSEAWTDFRLFVSWTSSVQAARRSFRPLDEKFFRKQSVAVYPIEPDDGPTVDEIAAWRKKHGVKAEEVLFGRYSRPEPNKWTDLPLDAFRRALQEESGIKLLLREPPPEVARQLQKDPRSDRFLILPVTSDMSELRLSMGSVDAVLHGSSIGESFGYGIAEPMNYGKPVIVHSVPWIDQAQLELARHDECGLHGSTAMTMAEAIVRLARDPQLRTRLGENAQRQIRSVAGIERSLDRLESAFNATLAGTDNPLAEEDLTRAVRAAAYLDTYQFGRTLDEQFALRPFYYRVRFHQWRKHFLVFNYLGGPSNASRK
jgi:glycosyltransferase involved in cell wall biosynthesis